MPFQIGSRTYNSVVGSDVARDGMYLEVSGGPDGTDVLLEIFYSDRTRTMTVTAFERDIPMDIVEWAIGAARERLSPDWAALEWWLDTSALPDAIWARLLPGQDGIHVHNSDDKMALFETLDGAVTWLREDEYDRLDLLKADGAVAPDLAPPSRLV